MVATGNGSRPEEVRVVTRRMRSFDDSWTIDRVVDDGGYHAARRAVTEMSPDDVIGVVKESGLRGRGGAGFPTGNKWSFVPRDVFPKYVVINHDEGEPGTFKDRELAELDPHLVLEGITIAAWAVQANKAFIYCRGEFALGSRRFDAAIRDAYERGFLGRGIFGSNFDLDVVLHRGAGAYICGEESALLDSLEGFRGQPRLRPPFPAVKGLYGQPTVINNTETVATLPAIIANGSDWFRQWGNEKSPGTKMLSVSGHVNRPANYEVPLGTSLADVLELAGGMRDGRPVKAIIPGGASAPLLTSTDIAMDFEALKEAGSMLGSGAVVFMDDTTCMVRNALVTLEFFEHESCGKCTPCREGTWWAVKVLERIEHGEGRSEDMQLLLDICDGIDGRSFCPLGDAAAWALRSNVKLFTEEFEEHVRSGACPFGDDHRDVRGVHEGVGLGDAGIGSQPAAGISVDFKEGIAVRDGARAPTGVLDLGGVFADESEGDREGLDAVPGPGWDTRSMAFDEGVEHGLPHAHATASAEAGGGALDEGESEGASEDEPEAGPEEAPERAEPEEVPEAAQVAEPEAAQGAEAEEAPDEAEPEKAPEAAQEAEAEEAPDEAEPEEEREAEQAPPEVAPETTSEPVEAGGEEPAPEPTPETDETRTASETDEWPELRWNDDGGGGTLPETDEEPGPWRSLADGWADLLTPGAGPLKDPDAGADDAEEAPVHDAQRDDESPVASDFPHDAAAEVPAAEAAEPDAQPTAEGERTPALAEEAAPPAPETPEAAGPEREEETPPPAPETVEAAAPEREEETAPPAPQADGETAAPSQQAEPQQQAEPEPQPAAEPEPRREPSTRRQANVADRVPDRAFASLDELLDDDEMWNEDVDKW